MVMTSKLVDIYFRRWLRWSVLLILGLPWWVRRWNGSDQSKRGEFVDWVATSVWSI